MSAKLGARSIPSVIECIKNSTNRKVMWNTSTENKSFVGLRQIYNDKTQTSLRANALTLYPVHLILLTFREKDRSSFIISGRSVVGFLPTEYESTGTRSLTCEMRMEMLQNSISRTFKALTNVAMEGFSCQKADGTTLKCHFALANYVCDLPEAWDVLGVKGQNIAFLVIDMLCRGSFYLFQAAISYGLFRKQKSVVQKPETSERMQNNLSVWISIHCRSMHHFSRIFLSSSVLLTLIYTPYSLTSLFKIFTWVYPSSSKRCAANISTMMLSQQVYKMEVVDIKSFPRLERHCSTE